MSKTVTPAGKPPESASEDVTGRLEGVSKGKVVAILATVVMFSEVVPLQYAMISTATPQIAKSFPSVGENIAWLTVMISLVGGAVSPLIGKMADIYGKKLMLLACSVAFLAGTLICALTENWKLFLLGRGLQGVAFAMTAIVFSLVRDLMPRKFVPIAIGVCATGLGLSAAVAPIVGGALTDHYSWRSLFWFLLIYMIVLIPVLVFLVPESRLKVKQKLDVPGAVLLGAGVALILVYVSNGELWGWSTPTAWLYAVGGVAVLAAFGFWEKRTENPMMDLKLLVAPKVVIVFVIAFCANIIIGVQSYATSYMSQTPKGEELKELVTMGVGADSAKAQNLPQEAIPALLGEMKQFITFSDPLDYALGLSLLGMALHLLIWQSIASMVAGPVAGAMSQKRGLRVPLIIGLAAMTLACAAYALFHDSWQIMMVIGILYGIGFGMYYAAAPNLIIEAVPQEQQGVSSGMLVVFQAFGAAVGTAIAGAVLAANKFTVTVAVPGQPAVTKDVPQTYNVDAYVTGFWALTVVGLIGTGLAIAMKHGRKPATGGLLTH